jgi:hypothetical protein
MEDGRKEEKFKAICAIVGVVTNNLMLYRHDAVPVLYHC